MDGGERGQALFEMALVLMLFLVVLLGVLAVAPRVYARLAVDSAAYDCATAAVETLSPARGRFQGVTAARDTLAGFRLDPARVGVQLLAPEWERGRPLTCIVTYRHGPSPVPWMDALFPGAPATTQAGVSLLIATFKSRW
jgi:hypothetical protein